MIPSTQDCYSCHREHGAVDTTLVQFYPPLMPIAIAKRDCETVIRVARNPIVVGS